MSDAVHFPRECKTHTWYVVTTYMIGSKRLTAYGCTKCNAAKQTTR